jgi:hypothetical protein
LLSFFCLFLEHNTASMNHISLVKRQRRVHFY